MTTPVVKENLTTIDNPTSMDNIKKIYEDINSQNKEKSKYGNYLRAKLKMNKQMLMKRGSSVVSRNDNIGDPRSLVRIS